MGAMASTGPRVTDYARTAINRTQGRSVVMTTGGIAASEHPLASQAGATLLARGGNAVDAAVAVGLARRDAAAGRQSGRRRLHADSPRRP